MSAILYTRDIGHFIRSVLRAHRAGPLQVRFDLSSGLWHGGTLNYPACGPAVISLRSVSTTNFAAAVAGKHSSVAAWASSETIQKPTDPTRNIFVPAWYRVITLDPTRTPSGPGLAAALRAAVQVKSGQTKFRL
jgi:hypothetical protein